MPIETSNRRSLRARRRRYGALALILVLAAAAVPAGIRVFAPERWGCVLHVVSSTSVDVPPDDATPEEVVRTYLRALDAHDADTAAELYPNGEGSWACNVRAIDGVSLTPALPSDEGKAGDDMAWVRATFTLQSFDETQAGQDNGPTWKRYELRRQGAGGPWRIDEAGQG